MTKLVESKNVTVLNGLERKIHTGKYCSSKSCSSSTPSVNLVRAKGIDSLKDLYNITQ